VFGARGISLAQQCVQALGVKLGRSAGV